jgi:hypothetical protein
MLPFLMSVSTSARKSACPPNPNLCASGEPTSLLQTDSTAAIPNFHISYPLFSLRNDVVSKRRSCTCLLPSFGESTPSEDHGFPSSEVNACVSLESRILPEPIDYLVTPHVSNPEQTTSTSAQAAPTWMAMLRKGPEDLLLEMENSNSSS